jgi:putative tryptophan/tyrosine transport system substrate-binding protein
MNRRAAAYCRRLAKYLSGTYQRRRGVLLSAFLSLLPLPVLSDTPIVWLLQSGNAAVYQEVSSSIITSLESICQECLTYQFKRANVDDTQVDELLGSDKSSLKLIVSIGVRAAQLVSKSEISVPKLYTLIPKSSASSLKLDKTSKSVSVIYLDQPLSRQLNLVKLISSSNQVLGVLFGPATAALRTVIEGEAKNLNIPTRTESIAEEAEVGPALRRVLDGCDILLALPDPLVYNRNTIFNILLSSYHNQIPVIGFSASYVKAGAMLAVHSTPSDIGMHIAETIRQFVLDGGIYLPDPEFPKYFSVEVNRSVARSLDINLPASMDLKQLLEQMEAQ